MRLIKKLFPRVHHCRSWEGHTLRIVRWYTWMGWSFRMTIIPFSMNRDDLNTLGSSVVRGWRTIQA